MKKYFFVAAMFFCCACDAQNLVPNPSFEDTVNCPTGSGQVWRADGWYIAENSPDYFNDCCNDSMACVGVPWNCIDYRYASSGYAYCGFITYISWQFYREKIGVELNNPLQIGIKYYVSFKVGSVNNHNPSGNNGATSKTGALFSTVKYDLLNLPPTNNFCQIWTDSMLTDTLGWEEVKGSFIADSSYDFMTIGNFFDDSYTDTLNYWQVPGNPGMRAYYFIDDVCVTTDSLGCIFGDQIAEEKSSSELNAYPNPANDLMTVQVDNFKSYRFFLYNSIGQIIYSNNQLIGEKNIEINIKQFPEGIYFLLLISDNKNLTKKISIFHN